MKPSSPNLLRRRSSDPLKAWNGETVYFQGEKYFSDLLSAIRHAKRSVDFEVYLFELGALGDRVVSVLSHAARQGAKVRVLVDGVGSPDFARNYGERLKTAGVVFRMFRSWGWFFGSVLRVFRIHRLVRSARKIEALWAWGKHRDHRKLCVVDGRAVWIGSFNVSDHHLGSVAGREVWRDTGIALRNVKSLVFRLAFQLAWEESFLTRVNFYYRRFLGRWLSRELLESPIRVTSTRKLRRSFRRELLERFQSARSSIGITTPYFVPTRVLLRSLTAAARMGLDVRLLLPGHTDVPPVRWASLTYYPRLLRAGCRIFEYQGRVLHAKTLLVDDWGLVGSSNLDHRSLRKDLEVNVIPQSAGSLRALRRQFQGDQLKSREVTLQEIQNRPLWSRALSWVFFQFRYWL